MERRRDIVILYRFVYQRSSDFERRHLRLRTISLRPYKDSVSMPFSQCPHKSQSAAPFPLLLSPKDTSPSAPIPPPPYSTNKTPQTPTPLPPSSPTTATLQAPHTTISTRSTEPIPCTSASHILRYPRGSTLRVPASPRTSPSDGLPRALRGTQYARSSVHVCTLLCTHVYSDVYTRV